MRDRGPLHSSVCEFDQKAVAEVASLLKRGEDLNARDSQGLTPLHIAAVNGNYEALKLLLLYGADTESKDADGKTALDLALANNQQDSARLLKLWANDYLLLDSRSCDDDARTDAVNKNTSAKGSRSSFRFLKHCFCCASDSPSSKVFDYVPNVGRQRQHLECTSRVPTDRSPTKLFPDVRLYNASSAGAPKMANHRRTSGNYAPTFFNSPFSASDSSHRKCNDAPELPDQTLAAAEFLASLAISEDLSFSNEPPLNEANGGLRYFKFVGSKVNGEDDDDALSDPSSSGVTNSMPNGDKANGRFNLCASQGFSANNLTMLSVSLCPSTSPDVTVLQQNSRAKIQPSWHQLAILSTETGRQSPVQSSSRHDQNGVSDVVQYSSLAADIRHDVSLLSDQDLRRELTKHQVDVGPIGGATRKLYEKRLFELLLDETETVVERRIYSRELSALLTGRLDSQLAMADEAEFALWLNDPRRSWRGVLLPVCFVYVILDPSLVDFMSPNSVSLNNFVNGIFYVGKGTGRRPLQHLFDAIDFWRSSEQIFASSDKIKRILEIWNDGRGVLLLQLNQFLVPADAHTREAAIIDAIGLQNLTNLKRGSYYGIASRDQLHDTYILCFQQLVSVEAKALRFIADSEGVCAVSAYWRQAVYGG